MPVVIDFFNKFLTLCSAFSLLLGNLGLLNVCQNSNCFANLTNKLADHNLTSVIREFHIFQKLTLVD